jgi:PAS domain S-box-containing protein
MAISPQSALAASTSESIHDSPGCVYSFGLDGNLVAMNSIMAAIFGYTREEISQMKLAHLLDAESWKTSREQLLMQLGGGGAQQLTVTAIAKDGSHIRLAVVRRLLFERGRPVAAQDSGQVVSDSLGSAGTPLHVEAHSHRADASRFAQQLKQLHRLSTTSYLTLQEALQDHLETGCRLLGLPIGTLLQVDGFQAIVLASHGLTNPKAGDSIPLWQTRAYSVNSRLRTVAASEPGRQGSGPRAEFETYLAAPVWVGSELFATLSFSGPFRVAHRPFSNSDRE